MYGSILAILQSLSLPAGTDPDEYRVNLPTIAASIDSAVLAATCTGPYDGADWCEPMWTERPTLLAASLIALGRMESNFLPRIADGRCHKWECDPFVYQGKVHHRARHYWQIQRSGLTPAWPLLHGSDYLTTTLAALTAARVLSAGHKRCGSLPGAMAAYARGGVCVWSRAGKRAAFAEYMERQLVPQP